MSSYKQRKLIPGQYIEMCYQDMMDDRRLKEATRRAEFWRRKTGKQPRKWEMNFGS